MTIFSNIADQQDKCDQLEQAASKLEHATDQPLTPEDGSESVRWAQSEVRRRWAEFLNLYKDVEIPAETRPSIERLIDAFQKFDERASKLIAGLEKFESLGSTEKRKQ